MSVHVDVEHTLGDFTLSMAMRTGAGLTALVGPSGAGKTSLLNILAGVIRPNRGTVHIDGQLLVDTSTGVWIPPHKRRIGYVFQSPRLFPHLTVLRNLTFSTAQRPGLPGRFTLDDVVSLLDLGHLLSRMPARLSGGEAQRVALGRALLSQPRLLLLDEPLVSVDRARRDEVLPYLDRLRVESQLSAIYVTHTPDDLGTRADAIVRMDRGRLA
jgi:molybdate transport system ATP-binding protein